MRASICAAYITKNILKLATKLARLGRASSFRKRIMIKDCNNCLGTFETLKYWEKYCQECFQSLMEKKKCIDCSSLFWGESWKRLCINCWYRDLKENENLNLENKTVNELSPDRIISLIKLVHPDRHQGPLAQLAHDTTCWLLELRKRHQEGQAA